MHCLAYAPEWQANCWRFVESYPRRLTRAITQGKDSFTCREDFEEIVTFLASVPLFKNQLPRSELPKVARNLKRKVWEPGAEIVKQGDLGKAFFLIMSGEADVLTRSGDSCNSHVRATLRKGDYFGGRTLLEERSNVATIRAGSEANLVTLSMSRRAFHDTGIAKYLKFPKRAAIYNEHPAPATSVEFKSHAKTDAEIAFIACAVRGNANLRALIQTDEEQLSKIAAAAEKRVVEKGEEVAKRGEALQGSVGDEFFIIREGSFDIVLSSPSDLERVSAEDIIAAKPMPNVGSNHLALRPKLGSPKRAKDKRLRGRGHTDGAKGFASHSLTSFKGIKEIPDSPDSPHSDGMGEDSTASTSPMGKCEVLSDGDSFGELSLLYNMRREATFRARERSVIYAVPRRGWESAFSRRGPRFDEYCKLLEEVHALEPLVSSERYELACNAQGFVHFRAGERVITQGRVRQARLWYVVYAGNAVMNLDRPDGTRVKLAEVGRPGCFGERSLLRGDAAYDVNVDAGENGMTCLTFNGETIRVLLTRIYNDSPGFIPDIHADIEEWCNLKAQHAESGVAAAAMDFAIPQTSVGDRHTDKYVKLQVLGRGAYGEVYLVQDTVAKKHYALKVMSKGHILRSGCVRQVRWERELLSMVDSKFVIRLHRTLYDEQHIYMLLEAALGGNLMELLHTRPQVFLEDMPRGSAASFYAACLTAALEYLHERCIAHRDIKPENAMLDEHGYAKLCDMGFARFVLNKTNTLVGTPEYIAPEVIDIPHEHDVSVDWWALGVMVYELLAGQTPFHDEGIADQMARLLAIRRSQEDAMQDGICFPFHFPSKSKGFVQDLLRRDPDRLGCNGGARAVREHDMFRLWKFDWKALYARKWPSPFCPAVDIPEARHM
ncbi:PRKG1 [Symbiodinium pilosum]|uniref:PRKG1 protein n=1 Tax=Symbiodinium pilosum TaxID=2952 RepID=A0A812VL08_SYMPI|nr:PRKG1 [Symbiodinium pilosum]